MENIEYNEIEPVINYFNTFQESKLYVKNILGNKQGPRNPIKNINSDGFYECKIRNTKKVWSLGDTLKERKCNITNKAGYGFRYCYNDINDKSSLKFLIIHYPKTL